MRLALRAGTWLALVNAAILLYVLAPVLVVMVIAFSGTDSVAFPPHAYSLRWFARFLNEPELVQSLVVSTVLALVTAAVALVLGSLAAFALVRTPVPGRDVIVSGLMSPLMVPGLVIAIAFLQYFVLLGLTSRLALLLSHAVITLPYVVRTMVASLESFDADVERAALSLGASRAQTLRLVTLPLLGNATLAASLFAFIISFENLPLALFLSDPYTVTLPMRIYAYMEWVFDPTVAAASGIQVLVVLVLVIALERVVGLSRLMQLR